MLPMLHPHREPPKAYLRPGNRESITPFIYATRDYTHPEQRPYEKEALVYTPPGFDPQGRYDVLYLIHGGGCTPQWYLGSKSPLPHMLDSMIGAGKVPPLLVCAVSYLNPYCPDATENCRAYHFELVQDVMPAFERAYPTYAPAPDKAGFQQSRKHRAFGGYSMGAMATWAVLEQALDQIAAFLPMSGDCWALATRGGGSQPEATARHLRQRVQAFGAFSRDYCIFAGSGDSRDMAEPNLTPQMKAMEQLPETFGPEHLYHCVCKGYGHDLDTALRLLYTGLPLVFGGRA